MNLSMTILGLPFETVLVGGGLFLLSTVLPIILSVVLERGKTSHE